MITEMEKISPKRRDLLLKLESIIGNFCYNGNIQNYGSGGVWEGEGRSFRYPITIVFENGQKMAVKNTNSDRIADKVILNGHYAFGANKLHIIDALRSILDYLEAEYGVDFDQ